MENYGTASTARTESTTQKKKNLMKTERRPQSVLLNRRILIGLAIFVAGLVLAFGPPGSAAPEDNVAAELSQLLPTHAPGKWRVTGNMVTAREYHTSTLLPNGQVLAAGGFGDLTNLASAELFDPATGVWTATGSMATMRLLHTATLLPNGKVLVIGGGDGGGQRGTIQSGDWDVDGHRQYGYCTRRSDSDVAAKLAGVGGRRTLLFS